jgi:hypothetical protein
MTRHLSEKYPSRSKAAKPVAKQPRSRAPPSVRPGPAKLDRQLSRDGDMGYQAVIEELPLPAGYTGPKMTSDMTMQAPTRPGPHAPARGRPTPHAAHATLHRQPASTCLHPRCLSPPPGRARPRCSRTSRRTWQGTRRAPLCRSGWRCRSCCGSSRCSKPRTRASASYSSTRAASSSWATPTASSTTSAGSCARTACLPPATRA